MKKSGLNLITGCLAVIILLCGGSAMAGEQVYKEVLDNGVTVIINSNTSAPVAAVNFWLRVGAAHEDENEKGLSHFIEHMMFKGTEKRKLGEIDKEIKRLGGYNNAFTSYDATNYVIVLPAEHVKKAIEIQFDALTASVFEEEEVKKEKQVILNELYRGMDSPHRVLWNNLMNISFDSHYKDPIIGYEEGIKKYTRADVVDYYRKYYLPDNLVIVVSGDVKKEEVIPYIKETFGTIERRGTDSIGSDGRIFNRKGFNYKAFPGKIDSRYLAIGFGIPDAMSEDIPKIEVLARILGGSESSRLYREVKEKKGLVDDIDVDIFSGQFGGILVVSALVREGESKRAINAVFDEFEKVVCYGVLPSEIERVKSDIIREQAKENMKVENMATNLGYYEVMSDYSYYFDYNESLKRVIDSDIKEAAEKYISSKNVNIAFYYPESRSKEFAEYENKEYVRKMVKIEAAVNETESGTVKKKVLPSGITLIHKKLTNTDIVSARFIFKGGVIYEGGAWDGLYKGITNLMLDTMMKGTKKMDASELAAEIDRIGAVFGKDIRKDNFGWSGEVINRNLKPFMELASQVICEPAFKLSEIRKEKTEIINGIKRIKDSPAFYADKLFDEAFFEWHPYGYYIPGDERSVKRIPSRYIKKWHEMYVTPNNLILSVAGNVDMEYIEKLAEEYFSGWKKGKNLDPNLPVKITRRKKNVSEKIKKRQSRVIIGFLGPKTNSKDYHAFRLFNTILSGGMDSRLFKEIRDKKNLCYSVFSTFDRLLEKGAFRIYAATTPDKEAELVAEIMKLLSDLRKNGVTKEEIKSAKSYIKGMHLVGFQDYMAQADSYGMYEFWGLGYKKVDSFLDDIDKVDINDVNRIIKKYITLSSYTKVIVGPE